MNTLTNTAAASLASVKRVQVVYAQQCRAAHDLPHAVLLANPNAALAAAPGLASCDTKTRQEKAERAKPDPKKTAPTMPAQAKRIARPTKVAASTAPASRRNQLRSGSAAPVLSNPED